ncbi:mannose-1-phosphate guanylyltransferase/mannose-6-phosphate isomerase [Vibrio sp. SM6]|uniref:mannose-1-phosphate guanylyltransferase n=1 Tax=Vibrio agarilyticus TaxID=2726741 RepID=A0A7X8TPQ1_9VIBR|nr:mannose-1-phosphate guanylyltransferase/mannose-6-phosphate isomerase [Vibrio agarilyticus]NLS12480.1 mannose-1-phosphate guanylyltransferase/mannose-6-phosphate isomerase [Vibrio agarilyticus]
MLIPVILAGGTGSRLWPLSRELYPKQFLNVNGTHSMLQNTLARLQGLEHGAPLLICNEEHRFIVAEQMRAGGFQHAGIILEPMPKNTAPAITLAALEAIQQEHDPLLLVMPADQLIDNHLAFHRAVSLGESSAMQGKLVTFGIVPTKAETGYGYIQRGEPAEEFSDNYAVNKFVEKPNSDLAQCYVDSGDYYWNSGMFLFRASAFIAELERLAPEMLSACQQSLNTSTSDMEFIRLDKEAFSRCPSNSIDYAIMEKTSLATVVPLDADWNDIGSWSALWEVSHKDAQENVTTGDVLAINSTENYLHAENKLVATVGVNNLVVVETKDAILVADKDQIQDVKMVVNDLKKMGRSEHVHHREVYRPWGKYDTIDSGSRDNVKRITVKPGEKLSIQMHHHRSEHWIVVSGTALVTKGDETSLITEDESTYIPLGTIHALENPGKIPLEMIEVQTGSYLSEDDIVRYEDRYGRIDNPPALD